MRSIKKHLADSSRKQTSLRSMFFSRFILLRYTIALFLFTNLYWLIIQIANKSWFMLLPIGLLIGYIMASAEQLKIYGSQKAEIRWTELILKYQMMIQLVLLVMTSFSNQFTTVFPIFSNSVSARVFQGILLILGMLLVHFNLLKVQRIKVNKDKGYFRYKDFEQAAAL